MDSDDPATQWLDDRMRQEQDRIARERREAEEAAERDQS